MKIRQFKGKKLHHCPKDFTVVDIETNGFGSEDCEILEISALKIVDGHVVDTFSQLIKPENPIGWFITNLTGISNEMVKDAPPVTVVLEQFLQFVQNDVVMGYNVNFDVNFLYDHCEKHLGVAFTNDYFDVLPLARKMLPHLTRHRQTIVAAYLGIETDGAHRALKDCEICLDCYNKLKNMQ